ncbi:MAG: hypothetical protein JWM27_4727 [Gemmatimonadetes bacterium]|nr:hypothetical protein [Gemmatimonadota bacterium]
MIDLDTLKLALRLDAADTTEDALLTQYEAAAVAFCERVTGRYFGPPAEVTEYLEGTGGRELWLADAPVDGEVVTVSVDGTELAAEDFEVRGRRLRLAYASSPSLGLYWCAPNGASVDVAVTYTRGYAPGDEPADARQAVLLLVGHWYETRVPVAIGTVAPDVKLTVNDLLGSLRRMTA